MAISAKEMNRAVFSAWFRKRLTTLREQRIIEAAQGWLEDRYPKDSGELALALALAEAFPERLQTKTTCPCGEQANCDECPDTPEKVIAGLREALASSSAGRATDC